jgi:pimeloyl-[acyl-carrier protein] synthase
MNINLKDKNFIQNPHPYLDELRKTNPIFLYSDNSILITGYKECEELLKREEIGFLTNVKKEDESWFSLIDKNDKQSLVLQFEKSKQFNLKTLAFKNPPEHTRLKKLFLKAFRKTAIEDLTIAIETICNKLADELKNNKEIELINDFCKPFTTNVILYLMGYNGIDGDYLRELSDDLLNSMSIYASVEEKKKGIESKMLWAKKAKEIFDNSELISNDGLLHYLRYKTSENEISEDEFISNSALLIMAGQVTTQAFIGSCVYYFLKNKISLTEDNINKGMQEVLRLEPPNLYITKFVTKDFEYKGFKFTKGSKVNFFISAANRDDKIFENNHEFDLNREFNPHISFGSGVHFCIGAFLALKETEIALKKLFQVFPNWKMKNNEILWEDTIRTRCLQNLYLINDSES